MQFLSDVISAAVGRPKSLETTALGAAWMPGNYVGTYPSQDEFAASWALDRKFEPKMDEVKRAAKYVGWRKAVAATLSV